MYCFLLQVYDGHVSVSAKGTFLEKMQQLKEEMEKNLEHQKCRIHEQDASSNRHELNQMIREANSISSQLNKHTVSSCHFEF